MAGKSEGAVPGLPFWKIEGSGNDFVLLDYRQAAGPKLTAPMVRYLLDRHRGIGGDGLLILRQGPSCVTVEYRNADGNSAEFCGNGARCAAAHVMGESPGPIQLRVMKIDVVAKRSDAGIAVRVGTAEERSMPNLSRLRPRPAALIRAGVDHWIVPVGDVNALDVAGLGHSLRHHSWPGSRGANVTFVEARRLEIRIRTYERGVEGETLACGSGCVAGAHWALKGEPGPINVQTHGGDVLRVWRDEENLYWLEGATHLSFTGIWPLAQKKPKKEPGKKTKKKKG